MYELLHFYDSANHYHNPLNNLFFYSIGGNIFVTLVAVSVVYSAKYDNGCHQQPS